jgi:hypothetical protein
MHFRRPHAHSPHFLRQDSTKWLTLFGRAGCGYLSHSHMMVGLCYWNMNLADFGL